MPARKYLQVNENKSGAKACRKTGPVRRTSTEELALLAEGFFLLDLLVTFGSS